MRSKTWIDVGSRLYRKYVYMVIFMFAYMFFFSCFEPFFESFGWFMTIQIIDFCSLVFGTFMMLVLLASAVVAIIAVIVMKIEERKERGVRRLEEMERTYQRQRRLRASIDERIARWEREAEDEDYDRRGNGWIA